MAKVTRTCRSEPDDFARAEQLSPQVSFENPQRHQRHFSGNGPYVGHQIMKTMLGRPQIPSLLSGLFVSTQENEKPVVRLVPVLKFVM